MTAARPRSLVPRLVVKDWYLTRKALALLILAGCIALGLLQRGGPIGAVGITSALIVMILLGILLPMHTVVNERKRQNLPFVMSLPISSAEYTTAKVVANLSAFVPLWLAIAIGVLGTFARAGTFNGLLPIMTVATLVPLVTFALMLSVSIVMESEAWSIGTMGACNISYSFWWYFLLQFPGVRADMAGPVAIWSGPIRGMLAVEMTVIVLAIALTFFFQSRKTDFI
jgi:ABC-2 type transport system permease protein